MKQGQRATLTATNVGAVQDILFCFCVLAFAGVFWQGGPIAD